MTNGENCDKITYNIIISIERNTKNFNSYRKCRSVCADGKMQEVNANLILATNYLVQLFFKTNKRYICTRTKIGKLLSIVAFLYARRGQKLFDEEIRRYNDCGTTIKELLYFIESELYSVSVDDLKNTTNRVIDRNEIQGGIAIPARFSNVDSLSEEVKEEIERVFLKFGAYSPVELGQMINEIIESDGIVMNSDCIDLESLAKIFDDFPIDKSNELIDYLKRN